MKGEEALEKERKILECLVQQGFTPSLARNVRFARSKEHLPLTIWICDNSTSMNASDGRRLVSTKSQDDVRVEPCTRWEELKETIVYHAQLAALLDAPTKFIMLNSNDNGNVHPYPQEMSIAERGAEWIEDDMEYFTENFSRVHPQGATPLTEHLRRIYQSLQHHTTTTTTTNIVLVLATDGRPTDTHGYTSPSVDRDFENALRQVQSLAWIVVRLCTNDDSILKYYQRLDEQMELSLEVLDDYTDEAKEVQTHNPWLTYSLCLHRCREMGMSCHATFRFLDWLDERALTRDEISKVLCGTFGLIDVDGGDMDMDMDIDMDEDWNKFCEWVQRDQERRTRTAPSLWTTRSLFPWNPITKRTTHWIDVRSLKRHGCNNKKALLLFYLNDSSTKAWMISVSILLVALVAIYLRMMY